MNNSLENVLTERLPQVTVIMPIRNEAGFIEYSIGSVLEQDYPSDLMEIIIADGMSTDKTRQIIMKKANENGQVAVRMIDNPELIVPTGFNAALQIAKGDVIIRVDGHTTIDPDYIRQCVSELKRTEAANVGGRMDACGKGVIGESIVLATSSRFGVGGARFHYSDKEEYVDTVYMGAWWKETFEKYGFFDEEQVRNQDEEFNYRLLKNGCKILLSPKIKSKYETRATLKSLWSQYFEYGYWKVRVLQKHPRQMRLRQFSPPIFVFSLLFFSILSLPAEWGRILFRLIAGSYILANLVASAFLANKKGWKYFFPLSIVYACLHFSYGIGFLVGMVRFASRWGRVSNSIYNKNYEKKE